MLSLFMSCCSNDHCLDEECMLTFDSYSNFKDGITVYLLNTLNNKIGFVYLYNGDNDLMHVNEIKKDKRVLDVLCSCYKEYYYNKQSAFAKDFQSYTNIECTNAVVVVVVKHEENELSSKWIIAVLKDNDISYKTLRTLILCNQYRNITVTPEPSNTLTPHECITEITFRLPNGNNVIKRKFTIKDTISALYTFIKSKAHEIFNEDKISIQYLLVIPHPYKQLTQLTNTIENEKLFPTAIIQIEETQ